jgi:hypothetical protein
MSSEERQQTVPPSIPYRTFLNFINYLKDLGPMPEQIDRSVMSKASGSVQKRLAHALRSMYLMNKQGIPSDLFKRLVSSDGEERKKHLIVALQNGFPFLFAGGFELEKATGDRFRDAFNKVPTIDRQSSIDFFLAAARDAGIKLSGHVQQTRHRPHRRHQANEARVHSRDNRFSRPEQTERRMPRIPAEESKILWGLFEELPKPNSVWPQAKREEWIKAFQHVLPVVYRDKQ